MLKNYILFIALLLTLIISTQAQTQQTKFRVVFEGNKAFSAERLLKKFNACYFDDENDSPRLSSRAIEYCLYNLRDYLQSQGYLQSKIGEAQIEKTANGLLIKIPIEEGQRYRLGEIQVTGSKAFTPEQLLTLLRLKTGDVLDAQEMREWIGARLEKAYADKGYIQIDIEVQGDHQQTSSFAGDGTANFRLEVDEGACFTVSTIKFVGQQQISELILRQQLLVKEGETFNRQALYNSIENLNNLDSLEWLDRIKDVDIKTDEERKLVNITIRIEERSRKK